MSQGSPVVDRRKTCGDCNKEQWDIAVKIFTGQVVFVVLISLCWGWAAYASSEKDATQNVAIAVNATKTTENHNSIEEIKATLKEFDTKQDIILREIMKRNAE